MEKKKLKSVLLLVNSKDDHKDLIKILEDKGLDLNTPKSVIPSFLLLTYMKGKNKLLIYDEVYIKTQIAKFKGVNPSKLEKFYDKWSTEKQIAQLKGVNPSELEKPMGSIFQDTKYIFLRRGYNPKEICNLIEREYKIIKSKY